MTTQEFSNAFDTLLNSYASQGVFGEQASRGEIVLDEYEKSVLLTQAQDIIVKTYFDRTLNPQGQGFDDTTRRQVDFSSLITIASPSVAVEPVAAGTQYTIYDERGILYTMPSDILVVLNEKVKANIGTVQTPKYQQLVVVPINYKEYDRQMSKAYAQPLKKQCWRLFQNPIGYDLLSELIPKENSLITEYKIRYIRRPVPIVLTNLEFTDSQEELSIDGVKVVTECELNKIVHMDILNKAVELAITTRGTVPRQTNKQD